MGLMALFGNEKKPRYPKERVLPSDVIGGGIHNSSALLSGTDPADFFGYSGEVGCLPVNANTAMQVAAVYGCVEKLCVIATLPKHIYERTKTGSERVDHDYWPLINTQPNENWIASSMWEREIQSMLLRGDGLARIKRRSASGKIREIEPLLRENVSILRGESGKIGYRVTDSYSGKQETVRAEDMLHFPGFGYNGYHGMSVIRYAAHSGVGIALNANQFSADFFANGQRPDYALSTDQPMKQDTIEATYNVLEKRLGGPHNRHKPLILTGGLKIMPITMTSEDSQLLETRQFQVIDICIAFGVPPQLVGAKDSTAGWAGSSLEQLKLGFATFTLSGHIKRLEQELNRKLFPGNDKYFVKFNLDSFLEGDAKTQADYFSKALGGPGSQGWMNVNEVRKLKNLPPDPNSKFDGVIESGSAKPQPGTQNAPQPD